jgi:hypothetical protein
MRWWVDAIARETTLVRMSVLKSGCSASELPRRTEKADQSGESRRQAQRTALHRDARGLRTDGSLLVAVEDRPELGEAACAEDRVKLGEEGQEQRQLRVLVLVLVRQRDRELDPETQRAAVSMGELHRATASLVADVRHGHQPRPSRG